DQQSFSTIQVHKDEVFPCPGILSGQQLNIKKARSTPSGARFLPVLSRKSALRLKMAAAIPTAIRGCAPPSSWPKAKTCPPTTSSVPFSVALANCLASTTKNLPWKATGPAESLSCSTSIPTIATAPSAKSATPSAKTAATWPKQERSPGCSTKRATSSFQNLPPKKTT